MRASLSPSLLGGIPASRALRTPASSLRSRHPSLSPSLLGGKLDFSFGFEVVEAGAELFEEAGGGREVLFEARDVGVR